MFDKITGKMHILEKSISTSWLRNEVISQNLSNVDTPGYKRKELVFEKYLADALDSRTVGQKSSWTKPFIGKKTDIRHLDIGGSGVEDVTPSIVTDNSLSYRLDGNNVDIESESAELARNSIKYNALIQSLNSYINRVRLSINEGRK